MFLSHKFVIFLNIYTIGIICRPESEEHTTRYNTLDENMHPDERQIKNSKFFFQLLNSEESEAYYWQMNAQLKLKDQLLKMPNLNRAKNVIFFLGDGMSIPTLAASRIYKGQIEGKRGEESELHFETFPYIGLSKTYCINKQVADSACSATAYLCGIKANSGTIGVTGNVVYNVCEAGEEIKNQVDSLASWAQNSGKATGIVTTTRVTHASPAGAYAHVANREYECDSDILKYNQDARQCQDIAKQLVLGNPGREFKVILGGGEGKFLPNTEKGATGKTGERSDGVNLITRWMNDRNGSARYVWDRKGLNSIDIESTDYILGLFHSSHMQYHLDADPEKQPSLMEMTETAIQILQKENNGFFLFIEGGRIDHGHHEAKARKALDETVEFSNAIRRATELTSESDTLIVVTSDHAHTMSLAGYSNRGSDILGHNSEISSVDGLPYTTLSYANGPGFRVHINGTREDTSQDDLKNKNYQYPGTVPLKSETHGGDDVAVFASGPWSHLFSGVYEQNVIPHIIAFGSCIGNGLTACPKLYFP